MRVCFDCHSNETAWPWYSHVAPLSWLVQWDVDEGRRELNFSEWDRRQEEARESAGSVRKGTMPPWYYPWGRLSATEREALISGLATRPSERASGDPDVVVATGDASESTDDADLDAACAAGSSDPPGST